MGKFATSMDLLKRSVTVIRENKKLLLFPLIVSTCILIMAAFYLAPVVLASTVHTWFDAKPSAGGGLSASLKPAGYLLLAGLYLLSMFIATFFNVAFFHEILHALDGRSVSVRRGVRFAASRLRAIAIWSLFAGLVGLLIGALEERIGMFGRGVVAVIGLAWSVASVFAIPAIVREDQGVNPVRYLKFSAGILRKTWGEAIIGYAGITLGGIALLVGVGGIVLFTAGLVGLAFPMIRLMTSLTTPMIALFVIKAMSFTALVGGLIFVLYVFKAINQVYLGALFIYATEGVVPGPFSEADMNLGWNIKIARKAR